jgi:hypothetical protein
MSDRTPDIHFWVGVNVADADAAQLLMVAIDNPSDWGLYTVARRGRQLVIDGLIDTLV